MPREGKARVLTEEEFRRLLKITAIGKYPKRNTALLYLSFGLGLRAKEMASLKIKDILKSDKTLLDEINLIRSMTKGEKQRHVYPINPKVRNALLDYIEERIQQEKLCFNKNAPLFRSQKGGYFSADALQQLFARLFKAAGIVGASSHSGRRTFATRLIEKGADIKAVSKLMGHTNIAMTAQYVEDNPTRLKKITENAI